MDDSTGVYVFWGLLLLAVIYVPIVFYLLTLQRALEAIDPSLR